MSAIKNLISGVSALLLLVVCAGCSSGAAGKAKDLTINIGYFPVVSPVPLMQKQKSLEKQGYTVHWQKISQGLPGAASALAAGKLDFTWGNSASAAVIFSQSPEAAYFVGQSFTNENVTVAHKGAGVKKIADLAGKKVVVSGPKTASTLFYEIGLKKAGVDVGHKDYYVSGTGPGMVGVMASGDVDVAAAYVPYSADMVQKGIGSVVFSASDALGSAAPGDGFIVSQKFANEHPDAVNDVLKAQFDATDEIEKEPDSAYKTMAKFAGVKPAAVQYSFDHGMVSIPDSYVPDRAGMIKVAKLAQQLGFAPSEKIDLPAFAPKFVKTSYAEKAVGGPS